MREIYRLELILAIAGIFATAFFLLQPSPTITGHITGVNITIYTQNLDLNTDGSEIYTLASSDEVLNLQSLRLYGEVIGPGRVEILLDNKKGSQYVVYSNVRKKIDYSKTSPITGMAIGDESEDSNNTNGEGIVTEKIGTWLAVQSREEELQYEFSALESEEEIISGAFYENCIETCRLPQDAFDSNDYELVFRIEDGTSVRLSQLKYTIY
jgi:hypothetical protein